MARYPGTETASNAAGWTPGTAVRCRRSRANAAAGVADARGFVCEVRPAHVRVLFDLRGRSLWLPSESVLAEPLEGELDHLRRSCVALAGQRLEIEEDQIVIFSEELPAAALDEVRALWGARLAGCTIAAAGVHEVAVRLGLLDHPRQTD